MKNYKELFLFLLFSLFCAFEAAGKGALNEFGNIEFWLMLSAIVLLVAAEQLGANKRFLMAVFMLATVGNLSMPVRKSIIIMQMNSGKPGRR